jgi:hypothetical protein
MKNMIMRLAVPLALFCVEVSLATAADLPCSDLQDMLCRNKFIESNLPIPHTPTEDDLKDSRNLALRKDILKSLKNIKSLRSDEAQTRAHFNEARDNNDGEGKAEAAKELMAVQNQLFAACKQVIEDVIDLHHLTPKITDPIPHPGSTSPILTKAWRPHYGEFDLEGKPVFEGGPTGATNIVSANIIIFPGAFVSEKELAAAIYHESVHWLNDNALGRTPGPWEDYNNELFAYDKETSDKTDLGLSYQQKEKLKQVDRARYEGYLSGGDITKDTTWEQLHREHPGYQMSDSIGPPAELSDEEIEKARKEADRQKKIQDVALENAAEERRARDAALRSALRDVVVKACADPSSVDQSDLDALRAPSDPDFFLGKFPEGIHSQCEIGLFMTLGSAMGRGQMPDLDAINRFVRPPDLAKPADTSPQPSPALAPTQPFARAMTPREIAEEFAYHQRWFQYLKANVQIMRDIVHAACTRGVGVSADDAGRFDSAYRALVKNRDRDHSEDEFIDGYEPTTALEGLMACDQELMTAYINAPENTAQSLNASGNAILQRYHPPIYSPQPDPRPRPDPSHCAASRGGNCVWR